MKTIQIIASAALLAATAAVIYWQLGREPAVMQSVDADPDHGHDEHSDEDFETGPHGGRLLEQDDFSLEITVFEAGIPPEFHLYAYDEGVLLAPDAVDATIELTRLGGTVERYTFEAEGEYLRSLQSVGEPHSFDVSIVAEFGGVDYAWAYENHEGRTEIARRIADAQGIVAEPAGPAIITETVALVGTVQTDPGRISQVRVRFPGIVTRIDRTVGDVVMQGETLGQVETNTALQRIEITAPISGLIVNRNLQVGQATGEAALFVIADLSEVWVQLDVFGRDLAAIAPGQPVEISTLDGNTLESEIDWVSPLIAHGSQSVQARVELPNPDNRLRPGQFVTANVLIANHEVPLAVRRAGLQTFRDFDVVYARIGDVYEVRMLELGRADAENVEVLSGLEPGEIYVSTNSYLVKADIEKAGATHDH